MFQKGLRQKQFDKMRGKEDGKATREQTAELIEFRTETTQNISDIKDTLNFILHKEQQIEKEIFALKQLKITK